MLARLLSHFTLIFCIGALAACSDSAPLVSTATTQEFTSTQPVESVEQSVQFDFQFSSILDDGSTASAADRRQVLALDPTIMQGNVTAENTQTGEIVNYPILVEVQQNFTASLSTLNFKPGQYDLTFSFFNSEKVYIGTQFMEINENTPNFVPVVVSPVIGDTTFDVQVESLLNLDFNINLDEINSANLTDPVLEVDLDGSFDLFFINTDTGLSQTMWLNVPAGDHSIEVTLIDQGLIVGQSQMQTIDAGGDDAVVIDIAPIYGQLQFDLYIEGGPANVEVSVPAAIVDAAGGLGNLDAMLVMASVGEPYFFSTPLILQPDGDDFKAVTTVQDAEYGLYNFSVDFFNMSNGEFIGTCFEEQALNSSGGTVSCQMQIQTDARVNTSLQSAVAVNVFDSLGFPIPGATVSLNGEAVGITGAGINTTPGYANVFVSPGTHIIRADFAGEYGEAQYEINALDSVNINIIMGQRANTNPPLFDESFVFNPFEGLDPISSVQFGCASGETFPNAFFMEDESQLALVPNMIGCSQVSAVTQLSFDQPEIEVAGGFEVSVEVAGVFGLTPELSIGIGEDPVADPIAFNPADSADAVVTVRDNEIEVNIYEAGTAVQTITRPTPFAMTSVLSVMVEVELATQLPGEPAKLNIVLNDNPGLVESVPFTWDGGQNHIEVRAGGALDNADVRIDRLTVRPR